MKLAHTAWSLLVLLKGREDAALGVYILASSIAMRMFGRDSSLAQVFNKSLQVCLMPKHSQQVCTWIPLLQMALSRWSFAQQCVCFLSMQAFKANLRKTPARSTSRTARHNAASSNASLRGSAAPSTSRRSSHSLLTAPTQVAAATAHKTITIPTSVKPNLDGVSNVPASTSSRRASSTGSSGNSQHAYLKPWTSRPLRILPTPPCSSVLRATHATPSLTPVAPVHQESELDLLVAARKAQLRAMRGTLFKAHPSGPEF